MWWWWALGAVDTLEDPSTSQYLHILPKISPIYHFANDLSGRYSRRGWYDPKLSSTADITVVALHTLLSPITTMSDKINSISIDEFNSWDKRCFDHFVSKVGHENCCDSSFVVEYRLSAKEIRTTENPSETVTSYMTPQFHRSTPQQRDGLVQQIRHVLSSNTTYDLESINKIYERNKF